MKIQSNLLRAIIFIFQIAQMNLITGFWQIRFAIRQMSDLFLRGIYLFYFVIAYFYNLLLT